MVHTWWTKIHSSHAWCFHDFSPGNGLLQTTGDILLFKQLQDMSLTDLAVALKWLVAWFRYKKINRNFTQGSTDWADTSGYSMLSCNSFCNWLKLHIAWKTFSDILWLGSPHSNVSLITWLLKKRTKKHIYFLSLL